MSKYKILNEDSPTDVMKKVAGWAQKTYPKYQATEKEGPTQADVPTLMEPADFVEKLPCIVYLGPNQQHYQQELKEEDITPEFLNNFGETIVKFFQQNLLFTDKSNYTATMFVTLNNQTTVCRNAKVINNTVTVEEPVNLFEIDITMIDINQKETKKKPTTFLQSSKQINNIFQGVAKSLQEIAIEKPTEENLKGEQLSDSKQVKIGDDFYSLTVSEDIVPRVNIKNYSVREIHSADKEVLLSSRDLPDVDVSLDELSRDYYVGNLNPEIDYDTCLVIKADFKQLSGKNDVVLVDPVEIYTTAENWKSWGESHNMQESLLNRDKPFPNKHFIVYSTTEVTVQAYDLDRKLYRKVIVPISNISKIKTYIYQFVNDFHVFFIDAYDNLGVCYFQAERMLDEENCYFWNVLKDDFYKKPLEYHYSQVNIINEDANGTQKWQIAIQFNLKSGDDSIPGKLLTINAESEELARRYAEQYIRKMSLSDENWKEASIDSISQFEGDI